MMMNTMDRILNEALQLPLSERARVAGELIASIDGPLDPDAEKLWACEIERRARRALTGESLGEDWKIVRQRVSDKLKSE